MHVTEGNSETCAQESMLCVYFPLCIRLQGYAVVDGVFGTSIADALRNEILQLQRSGVMIKNHTHLASPMLSLTADNASHALTTSYMTPLGRAGKSAIVIA